MRTTIATGIGKPPYVVLSDKSLQELAVVKPTRMSQLDDIYGFGDYKKNQWGERFIKLICTHLGLDRTYPPSKRQVRNAETEEQQDTPTSGSAPTLSYMEQQKQKYENAYTAWTEQEEEQLLQLYREGKKISEIAATLHRNTGAIRARIKKLELDNEI